MIMYTYKYISLLDSKVVIQMELPVISPKSERTSLQFQMLQEAKKNSSFEQPTKFRENSTYY